MNQRLPADCETVIPVVKVGLEHVEEPTIVEIIVLKTITPVVGFCLRIEMRDDVVLVNFNAERDLSIATARARNLVVPPLVVNVLR